MRAILLLASVLAFLGCGTRPTCHTTCTGCCSEDGQCLPGTSNDACGGGGEFCQRCVSTCYESRYCFDPGEQAPFCMVVSDVNNCRDGGP